MSPFDLLDLLGGTLVRGGLILAAASPAPPSFGDIRLRAGMRSGRPPSPVCCLLPALTLVLPVLEPPALGRMEARPADDGRYDGRRAVAPSMCPRGDDAALSGMRSAMRTSAAGMRPPTASSMGDRDEPMVARRAASGSSAPRSGRWPGKRRPGCWPCGWSACCSYWRASDVMSSGSPW